MKDDIFLILISAKSGKWKNMLLNMFYLFHFSSKSWTWHSYNLTKAQTYQEPRSAAGLLNFPSLLYCLRKHIITVQIISFPNREKRRIPFNFVCHTISLLVRIVPYTNDLQVCISDISFKNTISAINVVVLSAPVINSSAKNIVRNSALCWFANGFPPFEIP